MGEEETTNTVGLSHHARMQRKYQIPRAIADRHSEDRLSPRKTAAPRGGREVEPPEHDRRTPLWDERGRRR